MINSCYKLTLDKFMDCLFDNNLSVLGDASEKGLQENWEKIYKEFLLLRKDNSESSILTVAKEIELLKSKVSIINECLKFLWIKYNRNVANELIKLGFANIKLSPYDKPLYYKQLNYIAISCKSYEVKINKKTKELKELVSTQNINSVNRESFILINTNLSKYMGFYVNDSVITVANWCVMVNNLEDFIKTKEANKQKNLQ